MYDSLNVGTYKVGGLWICQMIDAATSCFSHGKLFINTSGRLDSLHIFLSFVFNICFVHSFNRHHRLLRLGLSGKMRYDHSFLRLDSSDKVMEQVYERSQVQGFTKT